jgi:hypothetical protein
VVLVAALLLPFVTVLLFAMDRVEDWMRRAPSRGGSRPRLRLVQGGGENAGAAPTAREREEEREAA